jgi:Tfp pilus assembly protein PilV
MRSLRGQTIIELLIAMSVIVVGLTASAGIIFSNQRLQERSAETVTASNLAREGIELAKAVRDSNWIAGDPFDTGLFNGTDYTAVPCMDGGVPCTPAGAVLGTFDFGANTSTDAAAIVIRSSNISSPNMFVQGTGATGTNTIFRRIVTLNPICSDYSVVLSGSSCPGATPKIGIQVTSYVTWQMREGWRQSSIVDTLYDWR